MLGGPAPVRRFLPDLMDLRARSARSSPARCSTFELPLADVAEGYRAMDERHATKVLLRV